MALGDRAGKREAQPMSCLARSIVSAAETIEDDVSQRRRDAGSVVGHNDHRAMRHFEPHPTAGGDVLDGIIEQVGDQPANLHRVPRHADAGRDRNHQAELRLLHARPVELGKVGGESREIEGSQPTHVAAPRLGRRNVEQRIEHGGDAADVAGRQCHDLGGSRGRVGLQQVAQPHLEVQERRTQLVRDMIGNVTLLVDKPPHLRQRVPAAACNLGHLVSARLGDECLDRCRVDVLICQADRIQPLCERADACARQCEYQQRDQRAGCCKRHGKVAQRFSFGTVLTRNQQLEARCQKGRLCKGRYAVVDHDIALLAQRRLQIEPSSLVARDDASISTQGIVRAASVARHQTLPIVDPGDQLFKPIGGVDVGEPGQVGANGSRQAARLTFHDDRIAHRKQRRDGDQRNYDRRARRTTDQRLYLW